MAIVGFEIAVNLSSSIETQWKSLTHHDHCLSPLEPPLLYGTLEHAGKGGKSDRRASALAEFQGHLTAPQRRPVLLTGMCGRIHADSK